MGADADAKNAACEEDKVEDALQLVVTAVSHLRAVCSSEVIDLIVEMK